MCSVCVCCLAYSCVFRSVVVSVFLCVLVYLYICVMLCVYLFTYGYCVCTGMYVHVCSPTLKRFSSSM